MTLPRLIIMAHPFFQAFESVETATVLHPNTLRERENRMAKVIVDSAEIVRVHRNGGGFSAHNKIQLRNGETKTEKYTVWTNDEVVVGQTIGFEGTLSVKMEEFTNDQGELIRYAAIHVNDTIVTQSSKDDAPF